MAKAKRKTEEPKALGLVELAEMIDTGAPIYVLNKSRPKGDISVTTFRPDGTPQLIIIPKTWVPICVTDQVPHEDLKRSTDFKKNIQGRLVQLVSADYAKGILGTEEGIEETQRLYVSKFADWKESAGDEAPDMSLDNIQGFAEQLQQEEDVNIKVKDILSRDISNTEKVHLLRAEAEELQKIDLEYIVANAEGKPKTWAEEMLEEEEEEEEEK
jgi:hypothetical protein